MSDSSFRLPRLPHAEVLVLLTSYNRRDYLAESLDSVLRQTWRDLHVLVIDDASPDGAGDVAREYSRRFPEQVSALCKPVRRGLAHSVNVGLSLMREAPYVAFQADDDLWTEQKLERQLELFASDPDLGLVATESLLVDASGAPTGQTFSDMCGLPDLAEAAPYIFARGTFLCAPSVVVSRAGLELVDYRYPVDGTCNDMYMGLVISAHMRIGWIAEPLTHYRRTQSAISIARTGEVRRESFVLRRYAFMHFEAVRRSVGGERARRWLERDAVFWATQHLRRGELKEYSWYVRDTLTKSRSPRAIAGLALGTAWVGLAVLLGAIRARLSLRRQGSC